MVALGTGLLWFGWFGFNGGSALASSGQAAYAAVNTEIAAATALCVWVVIEWFVDGNDILYQNIKIFNDLTFKFYGYK